QLRFQILARVQRLAVKATEQINGFEQRVQAEISQAADRRQESRVEIARPTARERGFDAEEHLEQRRDLHQADGRVQEHNRPEQQQNAQEEKILSGPESRLFQGLLEYQLPLRA